MINNPQNLGRLTRSVVALAQSLLDEMGADKDCTTLNPEGDLVVARPEAVYFYSVDGRGPCFVFEGAKLHGLLQADMPWLVYPRDSSSQEPPGQYRYAESSVCQDMDDMCKY